MKTVEGLSGIKACIICDSVSEAGIRLTTFEIEVPRITWCEFLTHSMLARNAASSRAIPFEKMQLQLNGVPVRFGKKSTGMQDSGEHSELINGLYTPQEWWNLSKLSAVNFSRGFYEAGYAKQIYNRSTEAYQMIKAVVTATEWANFFWLRDHDAADPTIAELARCMQEAMNVSDPNYLEVGEWHTPYVNFDKYGEEVRYTAKGVREVLTTKEAIKVSVARCAAVSFRNEDYTLEKCLEVYDRLIGSDRKHASAFAHQATPMLPKIVSKEGKEDINWPHIICTWQKGISHADREGQLWSAQFRGWIQNRKLIPGENYLGEPK